MPQWTLDALERVLLRIWTIFTASWVPTRLKWVRSAHLHRRKWERHSQIIFFPYNYLNNASQTATTGRSGGWLVKLSRIFPFVLREFYYRISTKESPVLNVERNVLVSVCTCGGKWRKLKHLKLVYFLSPSYAYSQSGCQRAKCAHELRIIEIEILIPLFRLKLFCVSLN